MSHASDMSAVFATDPPKPPRRPPATVRPDWEPPGGACPHCGGPKGLEAYQDCDGWILSLGCLDEDCEGSDDLVDAPWPFVENWATASDFRAAGWVVP
jgi:hypothetical protein